MPEYTVRRSAQTTQGRSAQVATSGLMPAVERLASGARAATRSRVRRATAEEIAAIAVVPTYFTTNGASPLTGNLPYPGTWDIWGHTEWAFGTGGQYGFRAEATGPGGTAYLTQSTFDALVIPGEFIGAKKWTLPIPRTFATYGPSDDLTFTVSLDIFDAGGGLMTPAYATAEIRAVCWTGDPDA